MIANAKFDAIRDIAKETKVIVETDADIFKGMNNRLNRCLGLVYSSKKRKIRD